MWKQIKFSLTHEKQWIISGPAIYFDGFQNKINVIPNCSTKLLIGQKSKSTLGSRTIYSQYIYIYNQTPNILRIEK